MNSEPYRWGFIDNLFSSADAAELVDSFPRDHFKTIKGNDGEKGYQYEARSLVHMGAAAPSHKEHLSPAWRKFAEDLLSSEYRAAVSRLIDLDLTDLPMEINISHYGPNAWLGAHVDLEDKIVTHVFYFNDAWDEADGGCLSILKSSDTSAVVRTVLPIIGNSAVLVRSDSSWHAVSPVRRSCRISRRSMTVTFYRPGSKSTMWTPDDAAALHEYSGEILGAGEWIRRKWQRLQL